jgi:transposase-like protein
MPETDAYAAFKAVRFADNGGEPSCPRCSCTACYTYEARRLFKCKACARQFTVTSGTIFASRKLAFVDILTAIAMFTNGSSGVSALRLGRDLGRSYKTAFILLHKLREVMGEMRTDQKLTGIVEVDGVWVGGKIRKRNAADKRLDRRKLNPKDFTAEQWEKVQQTLAKQRVLVTLRERRPGGRTLSFVCRRENDAATDILALTSDDAIIHADKGSDWADLEAYRAVHQVNHSREYVSAAGVHVNWVESYNSRVRRAEHGVYHRLAGPYLQGYADEIGWREDYRRIDNGRQFSAMLKTVTRTPVSKSWKGYWQRRASDGARPVFTRNGAASRNSAVGSQARH